MFITSNNIKILIQGADYMNTYFKQQLNQINLYKYSREEVNIYKEQLISELKRMNATQDEIAFVCDSLVINSIMNNRSVEDIVWAIMQ